jgi:hypothetical protein
MWSKASVCDERESILREESILMLYIERHKMCKVDI